MENLIDYLVYVFPEKHPILHACVEWTPVILCPFTIAIGIASIVMFFQ